MHQAVNQLWNQTLVGMVLEMGVLVKLVPKCDLSEISKAHGHGRSLPKMCAMRTLSMDLSLSCAKLERNALQFLLIPEAM